MIGRLDYHKRYDDAIRAMARVVRQVPDARLVIYGEGEDRDRLQGAVDGLGLRKSVSFAGLHHRPLWTSWPRPHA